MTHEKIAEAPEIDIDFGNSCRQRRKSHAEGPLAETRKNNAHDNTARGQQCTRHVEERLATRRYCKQGFRTIA